MTEQPLQSGKREEEGQLRDAAFWAKRVGKQGVFPTVPSRVINLNPQGRQEIGALQNFGPLWQKTYQVCTAEQEKIWIDVFTSPATCPMVAEQVRFQNVFVDLKLQWSQVGNVWHSAKARSALHVVATTWRRINRLTQLRNLSCSAQNASLREVNDAI